VKTKHLLEGNFSWRFLLWLAVGLALIWLLDSLTH
jgi:hypothetical protein